MGRYLTEQQALALAETGVLSIDEAMEKMQKRRPMEKMQKRRRKTGVAGYVPYRSLSDTLAEAAKDIYTLAEADKDISPQDPTKRQFYVKLEKNMKQETPKQLRKRAKALEKQQAARRRPRRSVASLRLAAGPRGWKRPGP